MRTKLNRKPIGKSAPAYQKLSPDAWNRVLNETKSLQDEGVTQSQPQPSPGPVLIDQPPASPKLR